MINIGDVYTRVTYLIGKDQFGKYYTPQEFQDDAVWNNLRLMDKYIAVFEATREISTNMRPFLKTLGTPEEPRIALDSQGRALFPDDFYYFSSGYFSEFLNTCGEYSEIENPIEWVDNATWNFRKGSMSMKPTIEYPVATDVTIKTGDKYLPAFQVRPIVQSVNFTYLRRPNDPLFGYTVDSGMIIYDPTTSIDLEWPESALDDFVELMVFSISRNIQDKMDIEISKAQGA